MPSTFNRSLLLTICVGVSLLDCAAFAQTRPNSRGRGGSGGWPLELARGGPLDLLQRSDVHAELELLDDQMGELRSLVEKIKGRRREIVAGLSSQFRNREEVSEADRAALRDKVREALQGLNQEIEQGLSFLLPHQRKRLTQLELQIRMRGGSGLGALASPEVGEQLAMTDEQRDALREKAMELAQAYSKKMVELRREMQEQLLAELDPKQRAKFQELLGDPFEFQDRPPGDGPPRRPSGGDRQ